MRRKAGKWMGLGITLALALLAAACARPAQPTGGGTAPAAPAPTLPKTITFIVPYSAGGGYDTYARGLAPFLGKHLGGSEVVVENIPGGGATEGILKAYNGKPDGSVILIMPMPAAAAIQVMQPQLNLDIFRFTYLGSVDENAYVIYVDGDGPYKTIEDLMNKKGLKVLTVSPGSTGHLAAVMAIRSLGLDAKVITGEKGSKEVATALIRGDVDFIVFGTTDLVSYVESGDIRPLLFLGREDQRPKDLAWLRNVKSIADLGKPEAAGLVTEARMIVAPPGMSKELTEKYRKALWDTMNDPDFKAWAEKAKRPIVPKTGDQAAELARKQLELMKELIPKLKAEGSL